jgi:hypothetical protein
VDGLAEGNDVGTWVVGEFDGAGVLQMLQSLGQREPVVCWGRRNCPASPHDSRLLHRSWSGFSQQFVGAEVGLTVGSILIVGALVGLSVGAADVGLVVVGNLEGSEVGVAVGAAEEQSPQETGQASLGAMVPSLAASHPRFFA